MTFHNCLFRPPNLSTLPQYIAVIKLVNTPHTPHTYHALYSLVPFLVAKICRLPTKNAKIYKEYRDGKLVTQEQRTLIHNRYGKVICEEWQTIEYNKGIPSTPNTQQLIMNE